MNISYLLSFYRQTDILFSIDCSTCDVRTVWLWVLKADDGEEWRNGRRESIPLVGNVGESYPLPSILRLGARYQRSPHSTALGQYKTMSLSWLSLKSRFPLKELIKETVSTNLYVTKLCFISVQELEGHQPVIPFPTEDVWTWRALEYFLPDPLECIILQSPYNSLLLPSR